MLLQENCGKVNHKLIKKRIFCLIVTYSWIKYVGFYFHQNIYSEIIFPHDWIGYILQIWFFNSLQIPEYFFLLRFYARYVFSSGFFLFCVDLKDLFEW